MSWCNDCLRKEGRKICFGLLRMPDFAGSCWRNIKYAKLSDDLICVYFGSKQLYSAEKEPIIHYDMGSFTFMKCEGFQHVFSDSVLIKSRHLC